MEENLNNNQQPKMQEPKKQEPSVKTKKKKAKIAVITLSTIIVALLGLQIYAATNGYGNVFFMIRDWTTTKNVTGQDEVFKEEKNNNTTEEETSKIDNENNSNTQLEPDNYAEEVMKYEKDTKGYIGIWKVKKAYNDTKEVSLQEIYGTSVKYGVGNLFLNMDNTFGDQIAPIYESEESRAGKYISSNNSITLTYNNGSKKSISYNPVDDIITYNVFDNYYLVMERQSEQQLEPDNYAEDVMKDEIKKLFTNKLKKDNENNIEKLLDYRVDNVEILSDKDKKGLVENDDTEYFKNTDTLAVVTYSVKPRDINNTGWIAGNGEISGNWIINKTANVCVRNGEIVFSGTGW